MTDGREDEPDDGDSPTIPTGAPDKSPRICVRCGRSLQKIGWARSNGARHHGDWARRSMHKACWKAMQPVKSPRKRCWRFKRRVR